MSQLKYFMDTHIPKAVAVQLRDRGVDVLRCEEVNLETAKDIELLRFATSQQRVMVSHDNDFLVLHGSGETHSGICYIQPHLQGNIGTIVKRLFELHELIEGGAATLTDDFVGKVLFIS